MVSSSFAVRESPFLVQSAMSPAPTRVTGPDEVAKLGGDGVTSVGDSGP